MADYAVAGLATFTAGFFNGDRQNVKLERFERSAADAHQDHRGIRLARER